MKKMAIITAGVLTVVGIACGSNKEVVRTERSYSSSTATAPLPPPPPLEERTYRRTEERTVADPLYPERTYRRTEERTFTEPPIEEKTYRSRTEERSSSTVTTE